MPAFIRLASLCLFVASAAHSGQGSDADSARQDVVAACKAHALQVEKKLDSMAKAPKGVFSDADLDAYRYRLAMLRHDLAMYQQEQDEQVRQIQVAVDLWEQIRDRVQKMVATGAMSRFHLETVEYQLACFRASHAVLKGQKREAIEQYGIIIEASEKQLADVRKRFQSMAVAEREVIAEQRRGTFARHIKSLLEGDSPAAIRHLRQVIELDTKERDRIARLRQSGAASEYEGLVARDRLSRTRCLLAQLEEDMTATIQELETQVKLQEKLFEITTAGRVSDLQLASAKHLLAHARDRLASGREGLSRIVKDHPIWELWR